MWWSNLFHISARLVGFACLITLFGQCEKADVDAIPPTLTLKKGVAFSDPVVQTDPQKLSTIMVNNSYDKLLATSPVSQTRPLAISVYESKTLSSIVQSITVVALPKHEFSWVATGAKNVVVCVFKNVILVNRATNEIENKSDLVWLWTPSKGSVDPGQATFGEGNKAVWNTKTAKFDLFPAKTLDFGYYVWCVLAWDKQGINIIAASRELPIRVAQ